MTPQAARPPLDDQLGLDRQREINVRVTGLQRVLVATLAEVIGTGVNNDGTTKDRVRTEEGDVLVGDVDRSDTGTVSLDVS